MTTAFAVVPHGVIGNTAVFGTAILGSSPGGEAFLLPVDRFSGYGLFFFSRLPLILGSLQQSKRLTGK